MINYIYTPKNNVNLLCKDQEVNNEILATSIDSQALQSVFTFYNIITTGTLGNGAMKGVGASAQYASYIGGKTDGYYLGIVNVSNAGIYNLQLLYRHGDAIRPMTIDVNGINTGTIYTVSAANPGIFNTIVSLNTGKNTIKFHGDGINYAPDLGMFYLTEIVSRTLPQLPVGTYDLSFGSFGGGASLGKGMSSQYVSSLGNMSDGNVSMNINISNTQVYKVLLNYINPDNFVRFMRININGVETGSIYAIPPATPGIFAITVSLNSGTNTIKFHGDGVSNAPNLKTMMIIVPSISVFTFYNIITTGTLGNGAMKGTGASAQYASYIGGKTDGYYLGTVNVTTAGVYNLQLLYRHGDTIRPMTIDINGINTGTIYTISGANPGVFNTKVLLNNGKNTIKFHGDGINYAPDLGMFYLTQIIPRTLPQLPVGTYDLSFGNFGGGASLGKGMSSQYVSGLGSMNDGNISVDVNVENKQVYKILLNYINPDNFVRFMKININGIETGSIYSIPPATPGTFATTVAFNSGINTIKFHGDGVSNAPNLKIMMITVPSTSIVTAINPTLPSIPITLMFNAVNGALTGGAKPDAGTNFAGWIGGPTDGATSLSAKVTSGGIYTLVVQYIAGDTSRPLKIDINGVNTGTIYRGTITSGWTIKDAKLFILPITLVSGVNTIKFHGDGINYGPSIGGVILTNASSMQRSISSTSFNIYSISLASLSNESVLSNTPNFVTNLGGSKDGAVMLTVNVLSFGLYTFIFEYLSGDTSRPFKIDINGVNTGTIYMAQKTNSWSYNDALTFITTITLNQGVNTIKIHGDGKNLAPYFGESAIWLNTTQNFSTIITPTQTRLGGSTALSSGLFTGIGGIGKGEVNISIYAPYTGSYDFAIDYLASDELSKIKIDVNGISTGTVYSFEATKSMNVSDEKRKIIHLYLVAGNNTIKIH